MGKNREAAARREGQWRAHIDAWQASEQTQKAFCEANRLKYANFCYWLRRFREQGTVKAAGAARPPSSFVPVVPAQLATGSDGVGGLSAHLPSGVEVRGISEGNIDLVAQLLARLR